MKRIIGSLICLLFFNSMSSQENAFVGMHGLQDDKGNLFFEISGYNISVSQMKGNLEKEKTLNKIVKEHQLGTVIANYSENKYASKNRIIESESGAPDRPDLIIYNACYLFQLTDEDITILLFKTMNQRDILLEKRLVSAYLSDELSQYIQVGNKANAVDFVGREIVLGDLCKWQAPNNLYCKGGQMNWSEFSSYQEAIVDLQAKVIANKHPDIKILSDEDVDVIFEDVPTVARRIVYMAPSSDYPLSVHYVAQKIRGRYVSCVLSNYVYNRADYLLSSLLLQVMRYDVLPENAVSELDQPELEEPHSLRNYWSRYNIYGAAVRLGAWIPMGNTSYLYNWAPSVSLTIGMPIKRDMALDLYVSIAFATGRKEFDYHLSRHYILDAKADALMSAGLRYRYQKVMAKNVYFTPYVGFGVHSLSTNQVKEKAVDKDDNDKYYDLTTIDLLAGVDLRYKRLGTFLEYHYTPYHLNSHAKKDLGNSGLHIGAYFVLF